TSMAGRRTRTASSALPVDRPSLHHARPKSPCGKSRHLPSGVTRADLQRPATRLLMSCGAGRPNRGQSLQLGSVIPEKLIVVRRGGPKVLVEQGLRLAEAPGRNERGQGPMLAQCSRIEAGPVGKAVAQRPDAEVDAV